ncbi:hypothetical protein N0V83_008628 [Neocucurbitaria cava]|uniref:Uncharacterized protein n=1 Tax=Neocucurbitaria cava TaxID=798079 RepID=A0A9W9CIX9_9PLEO|nr:hypothetical protein N0V83_008628 [Neocucurbitaria cava]
MGSIYQNSYITVSATNSGNGSARCLVERRKPIKIPYENTTKKEFALRARKILDHHPAADPNGGPARPVGPLTFRAWALQEHVLSTRVLHYTATELLFECKTTYRCECMPDRKAYPTTPSLIPKAVASKKLESVWQAWERIVEQYSLRALTVPSDKLPAISGIASKIRKAAHSEYLAGLWKGNLALDLLWHASIPPASSGSAFALETWRAPSFSWASLDVAINYTLLDDEERETFTPTVTLLASSITPTGLNPMGAVSSGSLTLRGPTTTATLSSDQSPEDCTYTLLIKGTSTIRITQDCCLVEISFKNEEGGQGNTVRRAQPGEPLGQLRVSVLCLSVARYDNVVAGLVLGVSEQNPKAWERVGTFAVGTEAFQNAEEKEVILV